MSGEQDTVLGLARAFEYCPRCGRANEQVGSAPFRCRHCQWSFYFGPVAAVGGLIVDHENRILLVKRAKPPGEGLLGLPGGFVDAGETAEQALRREIQEETGLEICEPSLLLTHPNQYVHCGFAVPVLDFFFQCRVVNAERLQLADGELSAYQWTRPSQDQLRRMAFASNRLAIEQWLRENP